MEFAFNLFIIGIVVVGFCFLLCIGGLLIAIVERIPALGKVFEWVEGLMLR